MCALNPTIPERLIRRATLPMSGAHIPCLLRTTPNRKRRTRHALIRIRRLLHLHLLMRALTAAATCAGEPEDARREAKGGGEPDDGQHLLAHGRVDVVGLEHGFEDADEHDVHGCCGCGGGDKEDCLGLAYLCQQHTHHSRIYEWVYCKADLQ
jgi:hypothetical protein